MTRSGKAIFFAMILPLSDKSACLSLQSFLTSHQSLWLRLAPFVISSVLTLNFAHFCEDSSRAKAALPRPHADTPIRRYADKAIRRYSDTPLQCPYVAACKTRSELLF